MSDIVPNRRYSKEEIALRGDKVYETKVRPQLAAEDGGKCVAIDVDSESFEVADDEVQACDRLRTRAPAAQIWLVRVGSPYLHHFGGRRRRNVR